MTNATLTSLAARSAGALLSEAVGVLRKGVHAFATAVVFATVTPGIAAADAIGPTADVWSTFRALEGNWRGEVSGQLGRGTAVRRYEFIFEDRYLVAHHSSVRLPQDKSPDGDHHRELAVFSYDRTRKKVVLREFNVEGYVLQYACVVEPRRFVCTSESIESGEGMRARVTVEIQDRYRFDEIFELAGPGKELRHYLTVRWSRVAELDD